MSPRAILVLPFAIVVSGGCFAPGDDSDNVGYMPDDLPAGMCRDTEQVAATDGSTDGQCPETGGAEAPSSSSTTSDVGSATTGGDACVASAECMGAVCAAVFDEDSRERQSFDCVFACVETFDDTTWCSDDASCCDANAECSQRGYCVIPESG